MLCLTGALRDRHNPVTALARYSTIPLQSLPWPRDSCGDLGIRHTSAEGLLNILAQAAHCGYFATKLQTTTIRLTFGGIGTPYYSRCKSGLSEGHIGHLVN